MAPYYKSDIIKYNSTYLIVEIDLKKMVSSITSMQDEASLDGARRKIEVKRSELGYNILNSFNLAMIYRINNYCKLKTCLSQSVYKLQPYVASNQIKN